MNYSTGGHEMSLRYKFVVQVVLMQNKGQGIALVQLILFIARSSL